MITDVQTEGNVTTLRITGNYIVTTFNIRAGPPHHGNVALNFTSRGTGGRLGYLPGIPARTVRGDGLEDDMTGGS